MRIFRIANIRVTPEQLKDIADKFNTDLDGNNEFEIDSAFIDKVKDYITEEDRKTIWVENVDFINFYTA